MAKLSRCETYTGAVIDTSDMTLTEFKKDESCTYDLKKILERWNGVQDIELTIRQKVELPGSEEVKALDES